MESRCKTGMVMASTRSGAGVGLRGDGVQVLGYRGFLMVALLFVTATTFVIEDVHCSITTDAFAPAPTPSTPFQYIATFNQYEADALNAVFKMWSKQNPQLSTLLNWSLEQHPCKSLSSNFVLSNTEENGTTRAGAWTGVSCTSYLQNVTGFVRYYLISVTALTIHGSNYSCLEDLSSNNFPCGLNGIIGHLPAEISNLTNLQSLTIVHNPRLMGPVPVEFFQMPNLMTLFLFSNSLSGTLPSDVYNADCKLMEIDLSNNNFNGNLRVSSQGTFFCLSLQSLKLANNSLSGTLSSDVYNADYKLGDM